MFLVALLLAPESLSKWRPGLTAWGLLLLLRHQIQVVGQGHEGVPQTPRKSGSVPRWHQLYRHGFASWTNEKFALFHSFSLLLSPKEGIWEKLKDEVLTERLLDLLGLIAHVLDVSGLHIPCFHSAKLPQPLQHQAHLFEKTKHALQKEKKRNSFRILFQSF